MRWEKEDRIIYGLLAAAILITCCAGGCEMLAAFAKLMSVAGD